MPRTIQYRPDLIEDLITDHRLDSYKNVFTCADDLELVGSYLWNAHVCSALYPLLNSAEVSLRNAIDSALTNDLGRFWWKASKLHYNSFQAGSTQLPFAVKGLRANFSKATKQVINDKKKRYGLSSYTPQHHEIIAKTEFSTWEFILNSKEFMGDNKIWPKNLAKVFKGGWPSTSTRTTLNRSQDLVKTVREFRNRVSHHEPVWKKFGVNDEQDAILHLHEKINKIIQLIELVHPEKAKLVRKHGILARAERACSLDELHIYQQRSEKYNVKSMNKLSSLAEKVSEENVSRKITIYKRNKKQIIIQPA